MGRFEYLDTWLFLYDKVLRSNTIKYVSLFFDDVTVGLIYFSLVIDL